MPRSGTQDKDVPALLQAALKEAGMSKAALSREWAQLTGTKPESKRRLLQKYMKGARPEEDGARQLARILKKPSDHFVTERKRVTREDFDAVWQEIGRIYEVLGQLSRELEGR